MNWRQFKSQSGGEKEEKAEKLKAGPLVPTFITLIPTELILMDRSIRASIPKPLAEEAARRSDFCEMHRHMVGGGACDKHNSLDGCLLWALVRAGTHIDQAGSVRVVPGLTVSNILVWVGHQEDIAKIARERRLLLAAANTLQTLRYNQ